MKFTDKEVSTITDFLEQEIVKQHGLSDTGVKRGSRVRAKEREEFLRDLLATL